MNRHLTVLGGTGFLGQHICKTAIQKGWTVTSLSRKGKPECAGHNSSVPEWLKQVNWCKGDLKDEILVKEHIKKSSAIVYSVGTLLESQYKHFLSAKDLLSLTFQPSHDENLSYNKLNRDFAIQVADEVSRINTNMPFVYLSAAGGFPGIPRRYIESKREAEDYICSLPNIRPIIMRPGFMYSKERPISMPLACIINTISNVNRLFDKKIPFIDAVGVKPLKVETVADAIIQSIHDETFKGIASIQHIEKLATVL
ncbi:unnamed protein product [Pneumocystis jirovecii]|uniref:NAD-dependent epimerase/dehydratase domain-containing protein n=2 Tax=Pneumocystis jirovecii TaxID=42068 RepID=L0PC78_PNEJI|nr:ubiquinone biosynthesis protein COQ11 [Pneumocystis jirovecii RU7]KTW30921.1 hypothetical protein T551_01473 [Pneumocystis jirovecii RU7]CCJ29981.1 unnamed protein product [Pneumocystis jirovecii]